MAFLDDELAPEERREIELHLMDCDSCRTHVDGERADIQLIRARLATPPASDLLKARIAHVLDAEDKLTATTERKRWSRWVLPGSALAAAAAALFVFVGLKPAGDSVATPVAIEVARQGNRSMPLEVQGPGTGPWLQQHFASTAAPPQFREPGIDTLGARLTAVYGHDAAIVKYRVTQRSGAQFDIIEVMVRDLRPDELSAGQEVRVGARTVHLIDANGIPGITYVGPEGMGYAFFSAQLDHDDLLSIIVASDLIERSPPVD